MQKLWAIHDQTNPNTTLKGASCENSLQHFNHINCMLYQSQTSDMNISRI